MVILTMALLTQSSLTFQVGFRALLGSHCMDKLQLLTGLHLASSSMALRRAVPASMGFGRRIYVALRRESYARLYMAPVFRRFGPYILLREHPGFKRRAS